MKQNKISQSKNTKNKTQKTNETIGRINVWSDDFNIGTRRCKTKKANFATQKLNVIVYIEFFFFDLFNLFFKKESMKWFSKKTKYSTKNTVFFTNKEIKKKMMKIRVK